jgi:hypothetical protein
LNRHGVVVKAADSESLRVEQVRRKNHPRHQDNRSDYFHILFWFNLWTALPDALDFRPSPEIAKIILVNFPLQFLPSQKQKM